MKRGLIIGISNYDNLPCLTFCKNDATTISDILDKNQYQISANHKLIGKITFEDLWNTIIDFFADRTIDPLDIILFYYSGHGIVDTDGQVYLASSEIDPDIPIKKGFAFGQLTTMMNKCKAKTVIVIIDSCYSGGASLSKSDVKNKARIGSSKIQELSENVYGEGKCVLAACQSHEEAYWLGGDYSLFTSFLIQGLNGANTSVDIDGNVTIESLGNYIYENITRIKEITQKPITKYEVSGKIVIVSYPHLAKKLQSPLDTAWLMDEIHQKMNDKKYGEAIDLLNKVIELNPNYARPYYLQGLIYKMQQKYPKALDFFEFALKRNDKYAEAWYEKGILLTNDYYKKYDDAIECFNKAMEFNPRHEDALNDKRRTIEKKDLINNGSHKYTNYNQNPIINIIDIRCSKDEIGIVHIIFNISEIRHESKDTNYTVNVIDLTGNILHHHESKIGKKDPNPAKICITFTLALRKGSYMISFIMENIVVKKEFETLDC